MENITIKGIIYLESVTFDSKNKFNNYRRGKMDKNVSRSINIDELEDFAAEGGNDEATPSAITTPLCAVVATVTVVTMVSGMVTTVTEICYG